jgi:hypothetical protein
MGAQVFKSASFRLLSFLSIELYNVDFQMRLSWHAVALRRVEMREPRSQNIFFFCGKRSFVGHETLSATKLARSQHELRPQFLSSAQ